MSFELNEEQKMIRAMVRNLPARKSSPRGGARQNKRIPQGKPAQMGELGLLGMNVPAEYDGAGVDTVSYSVALQEIAYACASTAVDHVRPQLRGLRPYLSLRLRLSEGSYLKPLCRREDDRVFCVNGARGRL